MKKSEQVRVLRVLMAHLDRGTNVDAGGVRRNPVSAYTCYERAEREWERLFRQHPQVVGMTGDLPEPGAFFTANDFGVPLLATRDKQGVFRAFANVCSHRGALVESAPRGVKTHFSCPFHAWTYNSSGELTGLPKREHFGALDKKCLGLTELPAAEKHGFLWVHPQPGAPLAVEGLLAGLDDEFATWGFDQLVHTGDATYDTDMNWKLAIDTFGETYHFSTLHKNTLFNDFHGNVQAYDTYGRNHRLTLCMRSIDAMRKLPEAQWHICDGAFPVYFLFPNIQVNVGRNGVILVRVYPMGEDPHDSQSRVSFYTRPEALAGDPDIAAMQQRTFGDIIRDEDYVAAASSHVGAVAEVREHFIFGRNEPALHHYHNMYREALDMPPLPLEPVLSVAG